MSQPLMSRTLSFNQEMLNQIRLNKTSRDEAIYNLYYDERLRANFKKMMSSIHFDTSSFESVFNHALMQFVSTVVKRKDFQLNSEYVSYITVIGRNEYIKVLKVQNKSVSTENYEHSWKDNDEPEKLLINTEKKEVIFDLLGKLGKNCREVLLLWANGYSMVEIANQMNYQSDGMARKKKYKCFKELNNMLIENPHYKSILLE